MPVFVLAHRNMRRLAGLALGLLAAALTLPSAAHAVPGDELWSARWCRPGADADVQTTAEYNGQLVIGGDFGFVGDVAANRVAIYDGAHWQPLGNGFNAPVLALCVYGGQLYAGGEFTSSGPTPLGGIARWNGSAWVDVGGGVSGTVETMVVFGGSLIAAGAFDAAGSLTAVGHVASWNGTTWSALADGVTSGDYVRSAAVFNSSLYIGGRFDIVDGVLASNVARWNGTAWSALGTGLTDDTGDPFEAEVTDLYTWSSRLVVTGSFLEAGGVARSNFATWNGTTWATLGSNPTFFSFGAGAIGEYAGSLLVFGALGSTYRWTGTIWSSFMSSADLLTIGHLGTDLVVGGPFSRIGGATAERVARFNGSTWSALATGDGASAGVRGFFEWNGQLVTGGSGLAPRFGGITGSVVASWNGVQWNPIGTGVAAGSGRYAVSFADLGGVLVTGGSLTSAGGNPVGHIAQWNGSAWSAMGTFITGCEAMKVVRGNLYAYGTAAGVPGVVRWTGSNWVSIGDANDIVWDLDEYQGRLVAAGTFTTIGGTAVRGLASWDSLTGTWSAIGASALNNSVFAVMAEGNDLYIAGTFTTVGGAPANRVAVWNGSAWAPLGAGVGNRVWDIERYRGDLFVTGEFTTAGGAPANYVARWDGNGWNPMGGGLNARGWALGVFRDTLFVGGDFTIAGGKYAAGLSTWYEAAATDAGPGPGRGAVLALRSAPSPFRNSTTISWTLGSAEEVSLRVYDTSGRAIATLHDGALPAGRHERTWSGRDDAGRVMAPGVYLYRIVAGSSRANGRLVRVP